MNSKLVATTLVILFTLSAAWTARAGEACCAAAAAAGAAGVAGAGEPVVPCPNMKDGTCPNCADCPNCAATGSCAQARGEACANCPGPDKCPHHESCPKACTGCAQPEAGDGK